MSSTGTLITGETVLIVVTISRWDQQCHRGLQKDGQIHL